MMVWFKWLFHYGEHTKNVTMIRDLKRPCKVTWTSWILDLCWNILIRFLTCIGTFRHASHHSLRRWACRPVQPWWLGWHWWLEDAPCSCSIGSRLPHLVLGEGCQMMSSLPNVPTSAPPTLSVLIRRWSPLHIFSLPSPPPPPQHRIKPPWLVLAFLNGSLYSKLFTLDQNSWPSFSSAELLQNSDSSRCQQYTWMGDIRVSPQRSESVPLAATVWKTLYTTCSTALYIQTQENGASLQLWPSIPIRNPIR